MSSSLLLGTFKCSIRGRSLNDDLIGWVNLAALCEKSAETRLGTSAVRFGA